MLGVNKMGKIVYELLDIDDVNLDLKNPRIAQYVEMYGNNISSEAISLALSQSSGNAVTSTYSALKESIRVNGGIINPILVNRDKDNKLTVIEGNTRLQIYKEFRDANPNGPWNKIIAIVYDNLPEDNIHAIRLQSHLVGPRDWDPYSKAKYLHDLSEVYYMPMERIISFCGGKKSEIRKLISAYNDMTKYYAPVIEKMGLDFDPRDFSKFVELQNNSIKSSLLAHKYTNNDFANWVINKNIDTAQNVRKLPLILENKYAKDVFLNQNISTAVQYLPKEEVKKEDLKDVPMNDLMVELVERIREIPYKEVRKLRENKKPEEKNNIYDLYDELKDLIKDIKDENE